MNDEMRAQMAKLQEKAMRHLRRDPNRPDLEDNCNGKAFSAAVTEAQRRGQDEFECECEIAERYDDMGIDYGPCFDKDMPDLEDKAKTVQMAINAYRNRLAEYQQLAHQAHDEHLRRIEIFKKLLDLNCPQ